MKWLAGLLTFFLMFPCWAAEDVYQFQTPEQQTQFKQLTTELRCLVCQNQNLAESNSGLADDLRQQVYRQVQQQRSDAAIIDYMVQRYGDFILYNPPLRAATLLLWFGPGIALLLGCGFLMFYLYRSTSRVKK